MTPLEQIHIGNVHQGAFTSLARDKYGADASSNLQLLNDKNIGYVRSALQDFKDVGADSFGAATFASNPHRARLQYAEDGRAITYDEDWQYDGSADLLLPSDWQNVNDRGVAVAYDVSGGRQQIPALIAPVTDTIGQHDKRWQSLGENQRSWAKQRHVGQVGHLLRNPSVHGVWVEALRYQEEAAALAELSREFKARLLVVSFRLEDDGRFPDAEHRDQSISGAREYLQEIAGDTQVLSMINCTGPSAIVRRLGDEGDSADGVYANTQDYAHCPGSAARLEQLHKMGSARTSEQNDELAELTEAVATTVEDHKTAWRVARERNRRALISVCCGATPELIAEAKEFHDAQVSVSAS